MSELIGLRDQAFVLSEQLIKVGSAKRTGKGHLPMEQTKEQAVLLWGFYELGLTGGWDFVGLNEGFDELFDFVNFDCVVNSQGVMGIDRDL